MSRLERVLQGGGRQAGVDGRMSLAIPVLMEMVHPQHMLSN